MGHIKEPVGVDFIVDPTPLTNEDRKRISEIIVHYKASGEKPSVQKSKTNPRGQKKQVRPIGSIKRHLAI